MVLKDALCEARNELCNINVPGGLVKQIGFPLARAIELVTACIDGIDRAKKEQEQGGENAHADSE